MSLTGSFQPYETNGILQLFGYSNQQYFLKTVDRGCYGTMIHINVAFVSFSFHWVTGVYFVCKYKWIDNILVKKENKCQVVCKLETITGLLNLK